MATRRVRAALVLAILQALGLLAPSALVAATRTVTDCGDNGTAGQLRTLINLANAHDTIVIPACTITLAMAGDEDLNASGDLDINKNLTIQGAGPGLTILDGGSVDRVIDVGPTATVQLSGVTIQGGDPSSFTPGQEGGGGIRNRGALTLTNAVVSNNRSLETGGIANSSTGILTLSGVTVRENYSIGGTGFAAAGGIGNDGTMTLTNVTITGNTGPTAGGLYNNGVATLTDVTVSRNGGRVVGGIYTYYGPATLTRVTVSDNVGFGFGGLLGLTGDQTLTNVTVSGNIGVGFGGGVVSNSGAMTLINVTVTGNSAYGGGGGIWATETGSMTLKNTIVADNTVGLAGSGPDCAKSPLAVIVSQGYNLIQDTSGCTFPSTTGDQTGVDPLLGPLQSHGGLTQSHALLAGSPAIDAGTNVGCPATDQRGMPRPQGPACDIGAYEAVTADQFTLTVTRAGAGSGTVTSTPAGIDCGATCSATFPAGTVIRLTAVAGPGFVFGGWIGGGCPTAGVCAVTPGADTTVMASFEVLPGGFLDASVNQAAFSAGQTLDVSVDLRNPGLTMVVDFYLGILAPDGDTIVFITGDGTAVAFGSLSNFASFRPVATGVSLASPFTVTAPHVLVYRWTGTEPRGTYAVFLAAFLAGALADGRVDPGDFIAVGAAPFTFGVEAGATPAP